MAICRMISWNTPLFHLPHHHRKLQFHPTLIHRRTTTTKTTVFRRTLTSSSAMDSPPQGYRKNVGICLINPSKQIFAASRIDIPDAWQMPQGGIDEGEDPRTAAIRELREETGVTSVEVLGELAMREACKYIEEKLAVKVEKLGKDSLINCAKTSMSSKLLAADSLFFASLPLFPGENAVDQLVEIIKVLGTPTREEIRCMNPNYTDFRFPQIKAHPWHKVFHKTYSSVFRSS